MNLVPYNNNRNGLAPLGFLGDFESDFNRLFSSPFFKDSMQAMSDTLVPRIDIYDSQDSVLIEADLPGLSKKEIQVTVHGNTLSIKGEKKMEGKNEDLGQVRSERFFGQFERNLSLGDNLDPSSIEASYKNGVLSLTVTKKEEAKPKEITVKVK